MTLTHKDIEDYLNNLVTQSVDVSSFYRMDVSEIQSAMRSGITYPTFALESHEANFEGSSENNSIENKTFAFSILKKPERGNFEEQSDFLNDCETIGKKFLARMRYDATQESSILHKLFDISAVNFHKVGPLYLDQLYGYRFEVSLKPDKANFKVSPSDWSDIETVC